MLVLGVILGKLISIAFFWQNRRNDSLGKLRFDRPINRSLRISALKLTLPSLLNIVSVSSLIPLITFFTDLNFSGQYSLAFVLLSVPSTLIGQGLVTILSGYLPSMNQSPDQKYRILQRLHVLLSLLSTFLFVPLFVLLSFGSLRFLPSSWNLLPEIMLLLIPWLSANLISSTLSVIATIEGEFSYILKISFAEFLLRISTLVFFFLVSTPLVAILAYSVIGNSISVFWIFWIRKRFMPANFTSRFLVAAQIGQSLLFWFVLMI
jgi:O-antigen/teichoic acid export membrane protein